MGGIYRFALALPLAAVWPFVTQATPDGGPAAGAKAFEVCAQCHSLRPAVNKTGPSLAGVIGRKAGSLQSFPRYSAALTDFGVTWNEQTLDTWLADPAGFIPHNLMTFPGVSDAKTRADIIALMRLAGPDGPTGAATNVSEPVNSDLKNEPPARQVRALSFCGDTYRVTTADGSTRPFWERNLRFHTDQSARGPKPGAPVILPTGMFGDRAAVVFAAPDEISSFIRRQC